jgi:hypothetical protein
MAGIFLPYKFFGESPKFLLVSPKIDQNRVAKTRNSEKRNPSLTRKLRED